MSFKLFIQVVALILIGVLALTAANIAKKCFYKSEKCKMMSTRSITK